jgi:hypothetical protein
LVYTKINVRSSYVKSISFFLLYSEHRLCGLVFALRMFLALEYRPNSNIGAEA